MTGEQLRGRRVRLGMSQAAFAEALGISERMLRRYEHGEWPVPRVVQLAAAALPALPDLPVRRRRPTLPRT